MTTHATPPPADPVLPTLAATAPTNEAISPSRRLVQGSARVAAIGSAVALGQVFAGERDLRTILTRATAAGVVSEAASLAIASAQQVTGGPEPTYSWVLASYGWKHPEAGLYAAGYLLDNVVEGVDQPTVAAMLAGVPPPPR